ncbi:MAG: acyl-CoA dehydrogenase [Sphingorhabdus sp.]
MLLAPNDEQREFLAAVSDALISEAPFSRWFLPQTSALADEARLLSFGAQMGWMGFAAPETVGGSEADLTDEVLLFMRLGAQMAPVGLCTGAIAVHGALAAGKSEIAAEIVSGKASVALASTVGAGVILGAGSAHYALRIINNHVSLHLFEAAPISIGFDWTTSACDGPLGETVFEIEDKRLVLRFELLVAAQLQGLAETALAESNDFAKLREQFGKPIGSFQAVRHRLSDMELRVRRAEAQTYMAAVALRDGGADAELQVLSALWITRDAARLNAEVNIQNHGAIGTTTENIGHLLLKRALLWEFATGNEGMLLDRIASLEAPDI